MAWSGDFGTNNPYVVFQLEIIPGTPNIAGNYTPVTVKLWARRTNTGYTTWGQGYVTLTVNGVNCDYGSNTDRHDITITSTNTVYHTWSGNIPHGSDGRKYLSVSGSIQIPSILSSSVSSYGLQLADIPRASSFTIPTSVNTGSAFTVSVTKANSSFNHAVYFKIGSETRTIQPSTWTGTSTSYTVPATDASYAPNASTYTASVVVDTYNGTTKVGTASKNITLNVPSTVKPTMSSLSATNVNAYWGLLLKGKSKVTLTANSPSGAYGSTIRNITFSGGGYGNTVSVSPWNYTTGVLNTAGVITFTSVITDSRGRSSSYTTTATVTDYYNPYFKSYSASRCLANGTLSETGTYLRIAANLDYCVVGSNTGTVQYRYREAGGTWTSFTTFTNNTNTGAIGSGLISTEKTYEVEIKGADSFSEVIKPVIIPTMVLPIDFLAGGNGTAIGKVATLTDTFDVYWNSVFRKNIEIKGAVTGPFDNQHIFGMSTMRPDTPGHYARVQSSTTAGDVLLGHATSASSDVDRYLRLTATGRIEYEGINLATQWENSNGRVIRFYNGTQICIKEVMWTAVINSAWGAIYGSGYVDMGNWAADFLAGTKLDIFLSTATVNSGSSSVFPGSIQGAGLSAVGKVELYRGAALASAPAGVYLKIMGIGRWK